MVQINISLQVLLLSVSTLLSCSYTESREFKIDYDNDTFLMDGKPFQYVSGSVHYFRMPKQYWRDRLRKTRAAGLNAISTYIEWSQHEVEPGVFDFSGDLNITEFIKLAEEEDLYVILRPGPYICAERDMGGLPFWLLKDYPDMYLRSQDNRYRKYVERWMDVLLTEVQPLLYGNGGPIILVQVENEYGSYISCDQVYTTWLRDLFNKYINEKAVLFTTDGASSSFLKCGKIPGVYATVDFGPGTNVENAFKVQRDVEPKGPLVNSEFYPGWLTHWGEDIARRNVSSVIETLRQILDRKANVNFYMFYGGTNFGFTAGANDFDDTYVSDITSYDYDAPITEAGDLTEKYYAIRDVVIPYLSSPNITVHNTKKGSYGKITLQATASLLSPNIRSNLGVFNQAKFPSSFEALNQNYGYLLYETRLQETPDTLGDLYIKEVHDYAHVYLNESSQGILSRETKNNRLILRNAAKGDSLSIVVENLGRINYGAYNNDSKGLLSNVTLDDKILEQWNMTSFEFKNLDAVENCYQSLKRRNHRRHSYECNNGNGYTFYMTRFLIEMPKGRDVYDTFLDMSNLGKGLVFVNGFNLGRYWSTRGPQKTLYVPGVYLNSAPKVNKIIVMEEVVTGKTIEVSFRDNPIFTKKKLKKNLTI